MVPKDVGVSNGGGEEGVVVQPREPTQDDCMRLEVDLPSHAEKDAEVHIGARHWRLLRLLLRLSCCCYLRAHLCDGLSCCSKRSHHWRRRTLRWGIDEEVGAGDKMKMIREGQGALLCRSPEVNDDP